MKKQLLTLLLLLAFSTAFCQDLWRVASEAEASKPGVKERTSTPRNPQFFRLSLLNLKQSLENAPMRGQNSSLILPFPGADGNLQHFRIWEAPVMHPDLAARHPDNKSYVGQGIENKSSVIRFSVTLFGLHAMVLSADNGTFYIDPYSSDAAYYIVYGRQGLASSRSFTCFATGTQRETEIPEIQALPQDNGVYRTYRTGIVTTVEYSAFHIAAAGLESATLPEKKAAVLAAVTVTITRVNSMFERDLSVFFQLIPNEEDVIFVDSDNLTDDDVGALIGETQETLDEIIGTENYDFGHGVGTSGGGLGGGQPCAEGAKAFGATGLGAPVGDPFDIDYVAHEMGHQFGAAHTFNNSCGGNRDENWSYEPGSGSSIMAYAGICPPNIQNNSNAQFFAGSIIQIRNTINGNGGSCAAVTSNNNSRPVANAGTDYTIPKGTAFVLTGSATDANSDALTYTWEQYDKELSSQPPQPTSAVGPNFKPQVITSVPMRYLPQLSDVLANNLTPIWEVISNVAREYNFAFTVRDNNPNGGESTTDFMKVNVSGAAGPFVVTSPNTALSWQAASNQNVTWNVAGTTSNGVNAAAVDILLSTNGGLNFDITLAENVPNDGSEIISVPNLPGSANRILVRGHGNIFYDVSNQNFSITAPTATFLLEPAGAQNVSVCQGTNVNYVFDYENIAGFSGATNFSASGLPGGALAEFSPASANADGQVTLAISNTAASAVGFYPITVTATSGSIVKTSTVYLNLLSPNFTGVLLSTPQDLAVGVNMTGTLTWQADPNASAYDVEIATDAGFGNLVASATVTANSFAFSSLLEATQYYWRVKPKNAGCEGSFSNVFSFETGQFECIGHTPTDVPVAIPADEEVTVASFLAIGDSFTIQKATVSMELSHTWVTDLEARLVSPSGTAVTLFSHVCGDGDDVSATFDDEGSNLNCGGSGIPTLSGIFKPETPLSELIGQNSAGQWTLEIYDEFAEDGGAINSWTLNLCSIEPALATGEQHPLDFALFPNPNNGSFTLQLNNYSGIFDVNVYDMRGRQIYENRASSAGGVLLQHINLNAQAGVYLVEISSEGKRSVKKFIVQ